MKTEEYIVKRLVAPYEEYISQIADNVSKQMEGFEDRVSNNKK